MKQIIKPAQKEIAEYVSDFSGKIFGNFYPHVQLKFEFNYGSEFDGSKVEFHLTDQEAKHVIDFIRINLSENKITELKTRLESVEEDYEDNMNARDWQSCDYFNNNIELYKYLTNDK